MSNPDYPAEQFRERFEQAVRRGFAAGFPNFYFAPFGTGGLLGGTILIKAPGATWRDVPLADLGSPHLEDFGARMRATQDYAGRAGYVGGFPTFMHADHGTGIVCGTALLGADVAEWRDVPLGELGRPGLDHIEDRFKGTQDYAKRNGFVGGFPNMYDGKVLHLDRPGRETVCGTILLRAPLAEWADLVILRDVQ